MATFYIYKEDYLAHHGVLGQKWGVRRYQNADGTYTHEGRRHYDVGSSEKAKRSLRGTIIGTAALGPAGALAGNLIAQFGSEETFNRAINVGKTIIGASLAVIAGVTVPSLVNNNKDSIDAGRAYTKDNEKELGMVDLNKYFSKNKADVGGSTTAAFIAKNASGPSLGMYGDVEDIGKYSNPYFRKYDGNPYKQHEPVTRNAINAQATREGRRYSGYLEGYASDAFKVTKDRLNKGLRYEPRSDYGLQRAAGATGSNRLDQLSSPEFREEVGIPNPVIPPEVSDLLRNNRRKNN